MRKKYWQRRNWSDDEKRLICAQKRVPGVSVSQVERLYDINANQLFNWLKELRLVDVEPPEAESAFLPTKIPEAQDIPLPTATLVEGWNSNDAVTLFREPTLSIFDINAPIDEYRPRP